MIAFFIQLTFRCSYKRLIDIFIARFLSSLVERDRD